MYWEPAVFSLPDGVWSSELESAIQACDDPIWIFDVSSDRMIWANRLALEFWNAESVEALAARDFSVGMSLSTRRRLAAYQRSLERGEPVVDRWTFFPRDRPQTMLIVASRVPGRAGVDRLMLRARPCETTHEGNRGVEALRHTRVMITLCTPAGRVLMQNPAADEAYGELFLQASDALRLRFASGVDADLVERALAEQGEFVGELRVRTTRGERWHALHLLQTIDPATGKPALLLDETNIDARKRSELALAAARSELESRVAARTRDVARQRAFVEAILDTSPSLMFVADAAGGVVRMNRALRDWVQGTSVDAWELLGDCDEATFLGWFGEGPPGELEVEQTSSSGERRTIYWVLQLFADGGETFMVGSGLDITERREMQLRAQTNDRMAALGTLASGVAHEINNPLAYVLTNVELAQSRAREGETVEVLRHLQSAAEACIRAAKIVADLKGFSQPPGPTTSVNLRAVVDSARRMMSHLLVEAGVFRCSIAEDIWVRGDETKLCQVMLNLLVNAAEACQGGGAEASIDVVARRERDGVVLTLEDTGVGMDASVRARIFDPFFTTKGRRQGTGLGLAISHRIVAQLGGTIEVDSEEHVGTTFTIRLPASPPPEGVAIATEPDRRSGRARVLIVDDEPGLAEAFALALSKYQTTVATSGVEALAALDADDYDVIVCDMSMPEMDGPALHAALSEQDPDMASRMVFVTGGAFTTEAHDFLRDRVELTLYKPVGAAALGKLIAEVYAARGPRP